MVLIVVLAMLHMGLNQYPDRLASAHSACRSGLMYSMYASQG